MVSASIGCEETYRDVEKALYQLSWKCFTRFNIPMDECLSEANMAFMSAYSGFDPSRGVLFFTYVYRCVQNALKDLTSRRSLLHSRESELQEGEQKEGRVSSMMNEMGDDARLVLKSILEAPAELRKLTRIRGSENKRRLVVRYFKKMGWTVARVLESLSEIQEALS